jgi:hypothetical protein
MDLWAETVGVEGQYAKLAHCAEELDNGEKITIENIEIPLQSEGLQ